MLAVVRRNFMITQKSGQFLQYCLRIPDHRQGSVFEGIKFADINIDKTDIRVFEDRFGGRCKIAVSRSDSDDEVCLIGNINRIFGTGRPEAANAVRRVIAHRSFAGESFADRNAGF
ncbi:hypothetical protein D3C87_1784100 [compost metagenome]